MMNKSIYQMELLDSSTKNLENLDYFIFCSGSDGRAYQVLSKINFTSKNKPETILLHFKERVSNKKSTDPLFAYKKFGINQINEITCEIKKPSSSLESLEKFQFSKTKNIGIDISCFTKPYFYFLIRLLKVRFNVTNINAYYTEPKSYFFPSGLFNAFHTSTGSLQIIGIDGYTGQEVRGAKRKLVILLGFDGDLSREISEVVSPEETIVVNGFPSYSPKFKDISLVTNEILVGNDIEIKYARANNPFDVYNLLESIKNNERTETFLNIAPLGTKPMALGACLFALHNPEARIIYPLPENYEDKYSDKCWNSWVYNLPLTI